MAIGAVLASDDLCALADALGADEADETKDDDERFDAIATRKAQTLLQVLELDACFRDERVARRVLAACFRVLAAANARALRETHESASRRVVAAEAAASARARALQRRRRSETTTEEDEANGVFGGRLEVPFKPPKTVEAFVTTEDASRSTCSASCATPPPATPPATRPGCRPVRVRTRYARASGRSRARNAIRFETVGGAFGVAAIKTRLCAALVTKTFSDAMASPAKRAAADSAAFVAEARGGEMARARFFGPPRRADGTHSPAVARGHAMASPSAPSASPTRAPSLRVPSRRSSRS